MRIVLKKEKTLILIALALLLLVVTFALLYFFKDTINLNLTPKSFDRYGEYLSDCKASVKEGNPTYKCIAFINFYDKKDDERVCFNLSLVSKGNRLKDNLLCEEKDFVKWDPETMLTTMRVPVEITFTYEKAVSKEYKLKEMTFKLLEDSQIIQLVKDLYKEGYNISNVRLQSNIEIEEKGYYAQEISNINSVTLRFVRINKIFLEGTDIFIDFTAKINGKEIPFLINSKEFSLYRENDENLITINSSNFVDFDLSKEYQLSAYYTPQKAKLSFEEFRKNCEAGIYQDDIEVICNNTEGKNITSLNTQIDEYMGELSPSQVNTPNELIFFFILTHE